MELLDLKIGGVTLGAILGIGGAWYLLNSMFKEWSEQRALNKELDEANRAMHEKYRWEPDMSTGSDQGKWVRRDGKPDYD